MGETNHERGTRVRNQVIFLALASLVFLGDRGLGQSSTDYSLQTGFPVFSTLKPVHFGSVNLANGNLHLEFPVTTVPQRGRPTYMAKLMYDSRIWRIVAGAWSPTNTNAPGIFKIDGIAPLLYGGWNWVNPRVGRFGANAITNSCLSGGQTYYWYQYEDFTYSDEIGTSHTFPIYNETSNVCHTAGTQTTSGQALDGSGFYMSASGGNVNYVLAPDGTKVCNPNGTVTICAPAGNQFMLDANGNYFSVDTNNNFTDTLNLTPVTWDSAGDTYTFQTPGGASNITVTFTTVYVHTAFGKSGVTEYQGHFTAIASIQLPGTAGTYSFTYDTGTSDTDPNIHYGNLVKISLPQGGEADFGYTNFTDVYGNINRWATSYFAAGLGWNAALSKCSTSGCRTQSATVTQGGNDAVYTFDLSAGTGAWKTTVQAYTGSASSGTLQATVVNNFNSQTASSDFGGHAFTQLQNTTITLPGPAGNLIKEIEYGYDSMTYSYRGQNYTGSRGKLTSKKEHGFGTSGPGAIIRQTFFSYWDDTHSNYQSKNIVNRVSDISVQNSAGTQVAETKISYDTTTLSSVTGMTHHDDTNYGTGNTIRGNPTVIQRWVNGTTGLITTSTLSYDTTGQLTQVKDAAGNPTNLSYSSTYSNAYPTQVSNALTQAATITYDLNTGLATSASDLNAQATSFSYDNFNRLINTGFPDGGCSQTNYAGGEEYDFYICLTSTTQRFVQLQTDGVGRPYFWQLVSDPEGRDYQTFGFDAAGRVAGVTNPYRSTSDPTYGSENYARDGLGRVTSVTRADGSVATTAYGAAAGSQFCSSTTYGLGYPVLYTDEAGKKRQSWTDALGRTIEVDEPDSGGNLTLNTCYGYDLLDDLTSVAQGSQSRSYSYDGLSRLTSVATPESAQCATTFSYDNNSNVISRIAPKPNQSSCSTTVTTTYNYDTLNRLTSKTYSDGTPAAYYYYDEGSVTLNGTTYTLANTKGRLSHTSAANATGMTMYSYDSMGRILDFWQCAPVNCPAINNWEMQFFYDLAGDIVHWTYPNCCQLWHTVDGAQHVSAATTDLNDSGHPPTMATFTYTAWGAVNTLVDGCAGPGCVQRQETYSYNKRLQPVMVQLGTSAATNANSCLVYNYYGGANPTSCAIPAAGSSGNNGNVTGYYYQDTTNPSLGHTANYSYDQLNRLMTAAATPLQPNGVAYNLMFYDPTTGSGYDRYGNMSCVTNGSTNGPCPNWTFNTSTNQITTSGFTYDAAGNMTADGVNTYQWDAEGRMASSVSNGTTTTYTYNALGQLMEVKVGGSATDFTYDILGNTAGVYIAPWFTQVFFMPVAGRNFVKFEVGDTFFLHTNHLGSTGMMTDQAGAVQQDELYYPWGGRWAVTGTPWDERYAGMWQRDSGVTGLDFTPFRRYSSRLGRWASPDPLAGDITNPQSLNRYAYVLNNPLSYVDPFGDDAITDDNGCTWDDVSHTLKCPPPPPLPTGPSPYAQGSPGGGGLGAEGGGAGGGGGGGGAGGPSGGGKLDVSKTWQRTFACGQNATQLMATVQSDFSRFANKFSGPFTAEFEPGPINKGDAFAIFPGLQTIPGFSVPVKSLVVTVSQQGPNGWVFTADPTHHFFNGTVAFSAADAGNGNVNFMVTVNANYASRFAWAFGSVITAGENSTWNNLLNNVQSYCASGGVQ
jgi:RHS repeat-associated protein